MSKWKQKKNVLLPPKRFKEKTTILDKIINSFNKHYCTAADANILKEENIFTVTCTIAFDYFTVF